MKSMRSLCLILLLVLSFSAGADTLIIGDSLTCGPFGQKLMGEMAKGGNKVTVYCAVSSTAASWLEAKTPAGQKCKVISSDKPQQSLCNGSGNIPPLLQILSQHKNSQVIVALGTNTLWSPTADPAYKNLADKIFDNGNRCSWIGPPHLNPPQSKGFPAGRVQLFENNLSSFYSSLNTAVSSSCDLIDSRNATKPGTPGNQTVDGVHRDTVAGAYWVEQIKGNLKPSSALTKKMKKTGSVN